MGKKKLVFIGAGGHAKSVMDCVDTRKYKIFGFLDATKSGMHFGYPIFGGDFSCVPDYKNCVYFVTIGNNKARKEWFEKIQKLQLQTTNIVDKSAIIGANVCMGTGNFIGKMAILNADVSVGDNNILNTKCLIEHECVVGSHCHLSTNSVINGNVVVEDEVFYGSSSVARGQLTIGKGSVVGAGSVVIRDVEPNITVVGVPARVLRRGNDE